MTRAGLILAVICVAGSSAEAESHLHWNELATYLKHERVIVDTRDAVYSGRFVATTPNAIVVDNGGKMEIARSAIVFLRRESRIRRNRLGTFEKCVGGAIAIEAILLATPALPFSVVAIPFTGMAGLIGIPILSIWDFFDRKIEQEDIVILPDPVPVVTQ